MERVRPGSKRIEVRDGLLPNFWLFIHPSGRKSFGVRYSLGGRRVKLILGSYPGLSLTVARDKARAVFERIEAGHDPRTPEAKEDTFEDAAKLFVDRHVATLRPATAQYMKREINAAADHWRGRKLADIQRRDVIGLLDKIEPRGVSARNTMLKVLRTFFKFCEGRDLITASPSRGVQWIAQPTRDRVLDDAELAAVWTAADRISGAYGALAKLLILTGMRRNEAAKLEWAEVGDDVIELPPEKTKTARPLRVPITSAIRRVLDGCQRTVRYVLKGARPLHVSMTCEQVLGVKLSKHWTWHDLRRTFASGLQKLGIRFEVIEAALNHKVRGIAGVYQRHPFEAEITDALTKWSAHIQKLSQPDGL